MHWGKRHTVWCCLQLYASYSIFYNGVRQRKSSNFIPLATTLRPPYLDSKLSTEANSRPHLGWQLVASIVPSTQRLSFGTAVAKCK